MQGCHTPPPPPTPWYPPLPVKWVVVLFGLVVFWSCLASSPLPPPPLWSGACGLFGWPRPVPDVWYGCCRLLVVMSSLRALSPPPPVGWGLWSFWLAPPRLCGAVCSTKICMVWLPLVSSNVISYVLVTIQNCSFLLANGAPVPALMRFILHRPLPLVCVGSCRLCGTAGSRGGSGARGQGDWGGGGIARGGEGGGGSSGPNLFVLLPTPIESLEGQTQVSGGLRISESKVHQTRLR